MNPSVSRFHAIFANVLVGLPDFDLIEMGAFIWHCFLRAFDYGSSDLSHVTKGHNHLQIPELSLTMALGGHSFVLRLDYLSCVLTIASTILLGRRCWEGWALCAINSVIICVIGLRTAQTGFIPANIFCLVVSAINLYSWRRPRTS